MMSKDRIQNRKLAKATQDHGKGALVSSLRLPFSYPYPTLSLSDSVNLVQESYLQQKHRLAPDMAPAGLGFQHWGGRGRRIRHSQSPNYISSERLVLMIGEDSVETTTKRGSKCKVPSV